MLLQPDDTPHLSPEDERLYQSALAEQKRIQETWMKRRAQMMLECDARNPDHLKVRAAIIKMCEEDPIFFFNMFAWTNDPRLPDGEQDIPFILYEFQEQIIYWLIHHIKATQGNLARRNLLIEKSRDMGLSWLVYDLMLWWWRFKHGRFMIAGMTEAAVDTRGDMDTPFEKLRWSLRWWPDWLLPQGFKWNDHDKHLTLTNPRGGHIVGKAGVKNVGRGGRSLMTVFDEFPHMENDEIAWKSAAGTTNVRLAIGTPNGPTGKFYRMATGKPNAPGEKPERVEKLTIHWKLHPLKSVGLTYDEYGNPSSPWYRLQVATLDRETVAAEIDIDYNASVKGIVYHDYKDHHRYGKNAGKANLQPDPTKPLLWVLDPGITFAALLVQKDKYNRYLCFREIIEYEALIRDVADRILEVSEEFERQHGAKFSYEFCGDPAGSTRSSAGADQAEYEVLRDEYDMDVDISFICEMSTKLRIINRIEATHGRLGKYVMQLKEPTPSFLVDVDYCPTLDDALNGKYRYKVNKETKEVDRNKVEHKQPWCDIADCAGYGVLYYFGISGEKKQKVKDPDEMPHEGVTWNQRTRRRYA